MELEFVFKKVNLFFLHFIMDKDPFTQIVKKWPPKGVFVDLLQKYLGMNAGLWSSVCVWSWIFERFFENFCIAC